jgi:hypothetical protein
MSVINFCRQPHAVHTKTTDLNLRPQDRCKLNTESARRQGRLQNSLNEDALAKRKQTASG